jgi:hypothetical protein
VVTSILPMLAPVAAIPEQTLTLTFSPLWTSALFASVLVVTCAMLWLLRNVERSSRATRRERTQVSMGFPRPPRHAVAGAGHRAA